MTDQEIAASVQAIIASIPHDNPQPAAEKAAIAAGAALLTNFLQNINAIAKATK
jgi:hypothetical protein